MAATSCARAAPVAARTFARKLIFALPERVRDAMACATGRLDRGQWSIDLAGSHEGARCRMSDS